MSNVLIVWHTETVDRGYRVYMPNSSPAISSQIYYTPGHMVLRSKQNNPQMGMAAILPKAVCFMLVFVNQGYE